MASAWGASFGVAWGNSWGVVAAAATPEVFYSGGYYNPPTRNRKKWLAEFEARLRGEVPQRVARTIARVALEQLIEPDDELDERLKRALERQHVKARELHQELLRREIQRIQNQEEEEIALLLLLH